MSKNNLTFHFYQGFCPEETNLGVIYFFNPATRVFDVILYSTSKRGGMPVFTYVLSLTLFSINSIIAPAGNYIL